jgi:hypothetical protein
VGSEFYDEEQAARMIAALKACRPEDRLNTLAVVCKVLIDGYLIHERDKPIRDPQFIREAVQLNPRRRNEPQVPREGV